MHSRKIRGNVVVCPYCGVGLVVECLPSKQETRVRFSYAAQNIKRLAFGQSFDIFVRSKTMTPKHHCVRIERKTGTQVISL